MTASRNRAWQAGWAARLGAAAPMAAVLALALSAIAAQVASAQQGERRLGAPVQLHPNQPREAGPRTPSRAETPRKPTGAGLEARRLPGRAVEGTRVPEGIHVDRLRAVDPASVGLLGEGEGGLGPDMWAGSRLDVVVALLARLPMDGNSPVTHDLARRLLLTSARVPKGPKSDAPSLLTVRLDRLAAAGRVEEIAALLRRAPQALAAPALNRARLDGLWLGGDHDGACTLALAMVERSNAPIWLKSAAFCHALAGDVDRVALYEELLLETEHQDEAFHALLGAASGRGGKPLASLPAPEPLHVAMLRANNWPVPVDAMAGASPSVARHLVDSENVPEGLRLEAAERAAESRVLPISRLRELYALAEFGAVERRDAAAWAQKNPGARADALLYQTARARKRPIDRAEMLAAALAAARAADRYIVVARANKTALETLRPVPGLLGFTAEAGRALLAGGEPELALQWYRMVEQGGDAEREAAWRALWPLLLVADARARLPLDPARFKAWWRDSSKASTPEHARRAGLLLTVLEALGHTVPEETWSLLYAQAGRTAEATSSPALLRGLARAAESGRRGETVLLALLSLGRAGPGGASATTLAAVIRALGRLGFEAEARAVALEAMLAQEF